MRWWTVLAFASLSLFALGGPAAADDDDEASLHEQIRRAQERLKEIEARIAALKAREADAQARFEKMRDEAEAARKRAMDAEAEARASRRWPAPAPTPVGVPQDPVAAPPAVPAPPVPPTPPTPSTVRALRVLPSRVEIHRLDSDGRIVVVKEKDGDEKGSSAEVVTETVTLPIRVYRHGLVVGPDGKAIDARLDVPFRGVVSLGDPAVADVVKKAADEAAARGDAALAKVLLEAAEAIRGSTPRPAAPRAGSDADVQDAVRALREEVQKLRGEVRDLRDSLDR
jgi:hypothetical protein